MEYLDDWRWFLKSCISNALDGTEDEEVWRETGSDGEDVNTSDEEASDSSLYYTDSAAGTVSKIQAIAEMLYADDKCSSSFNNIY
ncbi:hypothetical protein HZS_6696 [Henneguya salminicola]|nr:hypothetical protein HZS_6696 [Henneguya salminicola]